MTTPTITSQRPIASSNSISTFMNRVYLWMMGGLGVSAASAYYIASHPALFKTIVSGGIYMGLIIAQVMAVIVFSFLARKQNPGINTLIYLIYTVLSGVTLSVIAMVYTNQSIAVAFLSTAVGFCGLSFYGRVTKRDLSAIGTFCIMGLFGMIGVMLLSLFIPSLRGDTMQLTLSVIGIIVFSGLTAWDTQKIKNMYVYQMQNGGTTAGASALAVSGALTLYLDFINLFLSLLRLSGSRR